MFGLPIVEKVGDIEYVPDGVRVYISVYLLLPMLSLPCCPTEALIFSMSIQLASARKVSLDAIQARPTDQKSPHHLPSFFMKFEEASRRYDKEA